MCRHPTTKQPSWATKEYTMLHGPILGRCAGRDALLYQERTYCRGDIQRCGEVGELIRPQFPAVENDVNELGEEVILEE